MTEQAGGRRAGLIEAAQTRWIAALTDLGGRNTLRGISVVPQYGVGGYRVDFAATHPQDPGRMVLAIEADGASYRQSGSVRDRDRLRGEHLQRLGWSFHRLWSTNWFADPHAEVAKVRDAYQRAVDAAEPALPDEPEPPVQAPGQGVDLVRPTTRI